MSTSVSPSLQKVESALQLPHAIFANHNFFSVFDIVRQPRQLFINSSRPWLGAQSGKVWDLAMGQAQYIRRVFNEKKLTRHVRQGTIRTLSGQPVRNKAGNLDDYRGLKQDGPNWQNQFGDNWQDYCQTSSPEAYDSPVSYLTWLYQQAMAFEQEAVDSGAADNIIPLVSRRPDLSSLLVDENAINQVVPALQLVNEILESSFVGSIPSGSSVNETLAVSRYPTTLPWHFPHDQAELSLMNAGVLLEDIIGQTSTDWPWFLNNKLWGANSNNATELASRLAPEQQTIVTEPDNSIGTDLTAFYKNNLGLSVSDYTPFIDAQVFAYQLGLTVPQIEQLLVADDGGSAVITSSVHDSDELVYPYSLAQGHFGMSLSLYNEIDKFAWFKPESTAAIAMMGNACFSVSLWVNISSEPVESQIPLICNGLLDGKGQGICLLINDGCVKIQVTDATGNTINNGNKKKNGEQSKFSYNVWNYICLVWDSVAKAATVYYQCYGEGLCTIILNASGLNGDILTQEGFTWTLNEAGDHNYYTLYPASGTRINCLYDDLGIFSGALTSSDATVLSNATAPLPLVTGLSAELTSYFSFDTPAVGSEIYGASFINAHAAPTIGILSIDITQFISLNTSYIKGKYGQAIQTYARSDSYIKLAPESAAAMAMSGDNAFTLGFWICKNNYMPSHHIFNNNGDSASPSAGFCLSNKDNSGYLDFIVYDSAGQSVSNQNNLYLNNEVWSYIAVVFDPTAKIVNLYIASPDASITASTETIDISTLGDITLSAGNLWSFGTQSKETPENGVELFIYNDIAVFDGALTTEDINTIVNAGRPVSEMDISGFSASCVFNMSQGQSLPNLSDTRMDRINRMVRLQRWLEVSFEETDLLLNACIAAQGSDNTDFSLNDHALRTLGVFRHWQQKFGITAFQFAAVLSQLCPYAISPAISFLDQVFNLPSLFDNPFKITEETVYYGDNTHTDSVQIISQLCAGLGLTLAQFRVLAENVSAKQGNQSEKTFPLTLDVVSAFYRLTMIPRWLGLSFAEGAALFSLINPDDAVWSALAGVPQLAAPDQEQTGDLLDYLMALDAAADWAKSHGVSWVRSLLDLRTAPVMLTATVSTVNFVNGIKHQLPAALLRDQSFVGIPEPLATGLFTCPNGWTRTQGTVINDPVLLDSAVASQQYGLFDHDANSITNGSANFSMGMWIIIPDGAGEDSPLISNAEWKKQGIYISVNSGSNLGVYIYDDAGQGIIETSTLTYPTNKWFYLALTFDKTSTVAPLTVYIVEQDGTITHLSPDLSTLTGSYGMLSGNSWHLNEDGIGNFYHSWPKNNKFTYDDVTVWSEALSPEQITAIVTASVPASQTVPATLTGMTFTSWITTLSDLVDNNGLVLAAATDYDTIHSAVQKDIDGITFDPGVDKEQVSAVIAGIIYQAKLTQNGIADSALAQLYRTQQALSPFLLRWDDDSEYRLLSDTLLLSNGNDIIDPSVMTADDQAYLLHLYTLGQRAGIATHFNLTPAALSNFLTHPDWLDNTSYPLSLSLSLLYRLSRYADWLQSAIKEDAVLGYLAWVNGATPPDAGIAAKALAVLLNGDANEITQAAAELPGETAKTVADVDFVMRLLSLSGETCLSVAPLLETGRLKPGGVAETWDAWQQAGNALVAAWTVNP